MRFLIEYFGSQEPSVVLTGESRDFLELATALEEEVLRAVASDRSGGPLDLPGFKPEGSTQLSFGLMAPEQAKELTERKHSCLQGILIGIAGLASLYFFFRGIGAFFP